MKLWNSDDELFTIARRELFTAVVGDIMDQLGIQHQFLPPSIRPLRHDMIVIGRAMTVLEADVFSGAPRAGARGTFGFGETSPKLQSSSAKASEDTRPPSGDTHSSTGGSPWPPAKAGEQAPGSSNALMSKPFGLMLEALDDLKRNEVYICTGSSPLYALWGELMSTRAMKLGAVGAVVDGYSRDTNGILSLGFPTFSYGSYAQDQKPRGKVLDFRVPLEMSGVPVRPGEIVFGDIDGVCVIPKEAEEEVFVKALEKARGEKRVKKAIEDGLSACEAFAQYGIM